MRDRARRTTQATTDVDRGERAATRERRLRARYGVSGGYTGTRVVWSYQKGKKDERSRCRTHAYDNCVTPRLETRAGSKGQWVDRRRKPLNPDARTPDQDRLLSPAVYGVEAHRHGEQRFCSCKRETKKKRKANSILGESQPKATASSEGSAGDHFEGNERQDFAVTTTYAPSKRRPFDFLVIHFE